MSAPLMNSESTTVRPAAALRTASGALPWASRPPRAVVAPPPLARIHSATPTMQVGPDHHDQPIPLRPQASRFDGISTVVVQRPERSPSRPSANPVDRELAGLARMADGARVTEAALRRARAILEEAYESATEVRLDGLARVREQAVATDREARDVLDRARTEADRTRTQAALEAQLALQRAQRHADQVVARARGEAERITREARAAAQSLQQESIDTARATSAAAARTVLAGNSRVANGHSLEREFDATAREFVKWLGLPAQPSPQPRGRSFFRRSKAPATNPGQA